jgi:hypothetical protein
MQLEENIDYKFVESNDGNAIGVGFLRGKYQGVLYHYGKARVVEDEGFAKLQFSYTIDFAGQHDPDELTNDPDFHKIMGDLLTKILSAQIQDEKTRNYNSQEFDIQ